MAGVSGKQARKATRSARRKTLRGKLVLLVVTSVGIAVALVTGFSAWRDGHRETDLQREQLTAQATVLASLSAEATASGDRSHAFQALRAIGQMPGVFYARIQRADGSLLAEAGGGARLVSDAHSSAGGGRSGFWTQLRSRTNEVTAPVIHAQQKVGRITVMSRSEGAFGRLLTSLEISLVAACSSLVVGILVAWRLQGKITAPLQALTRSMDEVQKEHAFDRPVDIETDDEIGDLVDGFNQMLAEIRARDARIAAQVAGLESEVAARTADFREAKEAAEAANSAKSDFLATMSHEIRTPMNGIMVMAEMLAAGDMPPRQRRFAEVIANSGSSLLAIINDILDFSKIEAGKMELEALPVDLSDIVEDVCSLFWERAATKHLDLAAYVDPGTPRAIAGDPTRLRQVIGNLVNNAIKFTEAGGVLIEIEPDGAGAVRISVRDTGIGIPKDKIGTLFGAFSQVDQSTTRKFGGTGLGLAICKRLVEAMGGRFSVTSKEGRGSTFAFRLPVEVVEPAADWPAAPQAAAIAVVAHEGVSTRRALARYLTRAGFAVAQEDAADSGEQPALVLADASLAKAFDAKGAPLVCVAQYGDSTPYDLQRAGTAQAVLIQPFRRRELQALLKQLQAGAPLQDTPVETATETTRQALPWFGDARVLVADDSAVNREVAMEALARLGIEPKLVNDGREAVAAATAEAFDLVLMDGSMPEMDGYEAAREIRRIEGETGARRTVIIALTAHVVGSAADAWRDAGMDDVLHKPFTLASMAKMLGRFLTAGEPPARPAIEAIAPAGVSAFTDAANVDSELIDPEVAAQLAAMAGAGRAAFVEKVHGLYRENAPESVLNLVKAIDAGEPAAAAKAAHALKSMSYNVGARLVAKLAAEIEASSREGALPAREKAFELKAALERTLPALGAAQPVAAAAAPVVIPSTPMDEQTRTLLEDLEAGLDRGEFSLAYQPQVDRDGVRIIGAETLIRWAHPTRGPVSPALFIPIAEEHGLIGRVTTWVLDRLLTEARDIDLPIAFNASAIEFAVPGFVERLQGQIERHGSDPRRLEVEITETAILQNEAQVRENMNRLREYGLRIALDDFGAGYSSLGHLRRYPFDKLKIDREFITDCSRDVESATIVHAVVSIGRALGMKVIAEGVETETQRKFLKVAGVHAMQGYLFGKPVAADVLAEMVAAPPSPRAQAQAG